MGEEETSLYEEIPTPQTHDKWSVLTLALGWAAQIASVTAETLEVATTAALQHSYQKKFDRKFNLMTKDL